MLLQIESLSTMLFSTRNVPPEGLTGNNNNNNNNNRKINFKDGKELKRWLTVFSAPNLGSSQPLATPGDPIPLSSLCGHLNIHVPTHTETHHIESQITSNFSLKSMEMTRFPKCGLHEDPDFSPALREVGDKATRHHRPLRVVSAAKSLE